MKIIIFLFYFLIILIIYSKSVFAFRSETIFFKDKNDFNLGEFENTIISPDFSESIKLNPEYKEGSFLSPAAEPSFPFNEAVISWNIKTYKDTFLEFYIRTQSKNKWSNWFFAGRWMNNKDKKNKSCILKINSANYNIKNEIGFIDIDTLRLFKPAEKIQVKVLFHSNKENLSAYVKMLSISVSSNESKSKKNKRTSSNNLIKPILLNVPFMSQGWEKDDISGSICGPTSITMIMKYYNINISLRDTSDYCYDIKNNLYGNWSFEVACASEYGIYGYVTRLNSLFDIYKELIKGHPVITSIEYNKGELTGSPKDFSEGHLLVVKGFDNSGNVIVNDPAFMHEKDGYRTYKQKEFEHIWQKAGGYVLLLFKSKLE